MGDEGFDVGDAIGQTEETIGAGRQAHADVVRGDHATALGSELHDQVTPEEGPRRIAVEQEHRTTVARTVVDVTHASRERGEILRRKGIERLYGGR